MGFVGTFFENVGTRKSNIHAGLMISFLLFLLFLLFLQVF